MTTYTKWRLSPNVIYHESWSRSVKLLHFSSNCPKPRFKTTRKIVGSNPWEQNCLYLLSLTGNPPPKKKTNEYAKHRQKYVKKVKNPAMVTQVPWNLAHRSNLMLILSLLAWCSIWPLFAILPLKRIKRDFCHCVI